LSTQRLKMTGLDSVSMNRLTLFLLRFEGFFIPKGTCVVLNQWALHFDEIRFPDPWTYDPKRYVGTRSGEKTAFEALNAANPDDRDHWGYGAGRRWCPGNGFQVCS
jgi:cytochrome P450